MSVVYRQGSLVVDEEHGRYLVRDGVGRATVEADGTIAVEGDDEVVGVVAAALSARLRGEGFHVHAGAVLIGRGLVLVAGDSGAGKTTTSLALATVGTLLGDDVCFVRVVDETVVARVVSRALHVGDVTRAMFPSLELLDDDFTRAGKRRARMTRNATHPDLVTDHGWWPVDALVFPSIDRRAEAISRASTLTTSTTLGHLLQASAMVGWPGVPHAQAHFDALGRLARRPAFGLVMGPDASADVVVDALRCAGLDVG